MNELIPRGTGVSHTIRCTVMDIPKGNFVVLTSQVLFILFVNSGVPTLNALLRNLMYSFMMRLMDSKNEIIMTLTMPKLSSIRYTSSLWKHWRECLYVF